MLFVAMKFSTKVKSIVYGVEFTHGVRRALVSALILIYFISLGFNVISITSLFAISTLIMTFFEFPTGAVADYDSRKRSLMISFFLMSLSFLGIFLFRNFWILAGFWILNDIAWTFSTGAGSAWAIDALGYGKKKIKIVSLVSKRNISERLGHLIGGLIGMIVVAINFRFVWLMISASYLVLFFIAWKYMDERNFKPEKISHGYVRKSLIKTKESFEYIIHKNNKILRTLMIGSFVRIMALSAFFIAMPLFFTEELGLLPEHLSGVIALVAGLTMATPLIAENMARIKGVTKSLIFVPFAMSIFILTLALSKSFVFAIFFFLLLKTTSVIGTVLQESAEQHEYDSKIRSSLGSINGIIWAVAFAISVFLAGLSIEFFGVVNTLILCSLLVLIQGFIFLFGFRKIKKS